jgi:hypothetical protein
MEKNLCWRNPFKKHQMISFTNSNKVIYYTQYQVLKMNLEYILYLFKKNIWSIIMFIITIIGILITL